MIGGIHFGCQANGTSFLFRKFVFAGNNENELLIDEPHVVITYGGVEEPVLYLTDRYKSQALSALVQAFVASCTTCHRI